MRSYKKSFIIPWDNADVKIRQGSDPGAIDAKSLLLAANQVANNGETPFWLDAAYWHRSGRRILELGPKLCAGFTKTPVIGINLSDVRQALDKIGPVYVATKGQSTIFNDRHEYSIEGFYVVKAPATIRIHAWTHLCWNDNGGGETNDTIMWSIPMTTPQIHAVSTPLWRNWPNCDFLMGGECHPVIPTNDSITEWGVNVALGAIIYAASAKADMEDLAPESWIAEIEALERNAQRTPSAKKKTKLLEKVRKMRENPRDVVTYLGPKIERELAEGEAAERAASGERGPLIKHLVRGHWHTYLSGPGKTIRQLQWTHPYTRGTVPIGDTIVKIRESVAEEYL